MFIQPYRPPLRLPPPVPVAERAVAPRPAKAPAEPFKRRTHGGDWVKLNRNETDHDDDSVIIDGSSRDEDDEDEGNTHPRLVPDGLFATAANPDVPQITAAQVTTTVPYVRVASTLPTPIAQFAQVLSSEDLSESRPDPVLPQIRASVGPTNVPKVQLCQSLTSLFQFSSKTFLFCGVGSGHHPAPTACKFYYLRNERFI
jgi:hypothetical protein